MTEKEKIVRSLLKTKGSYCDSDDCSGDVGTYNKNIICPVYIKYCAKLTKTDWLCREVSDDQAYETACKWFIKKYGHDKLIEELL